MYWKARAAIRFRRRCTGQVARAAAGAFAILAALPLVADEPQLLKTFRAEFVEITPGRGAFPRSFQMGGNDDPSAQPIHEVRLGYDFAVARYEVPQNLWQAVMESNPSRWKGDRNSVEMVTWDEAQEFCRRATLQLRAARLIEPAQLVRLPTEAEWEYVARAGTSTRYSFGNTPAELADYGWFTGNAAGNDPPVGAKKPNPWGLYDVHGYLWEWCADHGHPTYDGAPTDGSAWTAGGEGEQRVIRGGSWKDPAEQLTSAVRSGTLRSPHGGPPLVFRGGVPRALRDDAVGFRCVLATPPQ